MDWKEGVPSGTGPCPWTASPAGPREGLAAEDKTPVEPASAHLAHSGVAQGICRPPQRTKRQVTPGVPQLPPSQKAAALPWKPFPVCPINGCSRTAGASP